MQSMEGLKITCCFAVIYGFQLWRAGGILSLGSQWIKKDQVQLRMFPVWFQDASALNMAVKAE